IDDDVHDELLNLNDVGLNRSEMFFKLESQLNGRGYRGFNQRSSLSNPGGQVHSLNKKASLPRISEHLTRQLSSLLAGLDYVFHASLCSRAWLHILHRKAGVSQNSSKQVVKVVRNSACQNA